MADKVNFMFSYICEIWAHKTSGSNWTMVHFGGNTIFCLTYEKYFIQKYFAIMFGSQEVCWEEEEREAMEPISDLPVRRLLDLPSHNLVVG